MEKKVCLIHVAWTNLEIIGKSFMVMNGELSLNRMSSSQNASRDDDDDDVHHPPLVDVRAF